VPFWSLQLLAPGAAAFPIDPSQFVKPEVAVERVKRRESCAQHFLKNDSYLGQAHHPNRWCWGGLDMIANILRTEWIQAALPLVLTLAVIGAGVAFALS